MFKSNTFTLNRSITIIVSMPLDLGRCTGTKLSWVCSSKSGIRETVLLFLRIQMVSCTGPPALSDKWQNSTFHPLPSLYLSAVRDIPTESTVGCIDEGSTGEGFI